MDVTRGVVLAQCIFFLFCAHTQTSRDHILASRGSFVMLCTPIERYCLLLSFFVYSIGVRLVLCFKTFILYKLNRAGKRSFLHNRSLLHRAVFYYYTHMVRYLSREGVVMDDVLSIIMH